MLHTEGPKFARSLALLAVALVTSAPGAGELSFLECVARLSTVQLYIDNALAFVVKALSLCLLLCVTVSASYF